MISNPEIAGDVCTYLCSGIYLGPETEEWTRMDHSLFKAGAHNILPVSHAVKQYENTPPQLQAMLPSPQANINRLSHEFFNATLLRLWSMKVVGGVYIMYNCIGDEFMSGDLYRHYVNHLNHAHLYDRFRCRSSRKMLRLKAWILEVKARRQPLLSMGPVPGLVGPPPGVRLAPDL